MKRITDQQLADFGDAMIAGMLWLVLALILVFSLCCGCNVTTQVRPWFSKPPSEPPAVQPAPQPPPPKDDWAPPWFRRPKHRMDSKIDNPRPMLHDGEWPPIIHTPINPNETP